MTKGIIRDEPPFDVAAVPHLGAYDQIGRAFARHWDLVVAHGLTGQQGPGVGFYHDSPAEVPEADLRSHAGVKIAVGMALPDVFERLSVAGGRVAVLTHKGPYAGLKAAWNTLCANWLPGSGETVSGLAPYEVYLNAPHVTAFANLLTEICQPLRAQRA